MSKKPRGGPRGATYRPGAFGVNLRRLRYKAGLTQDELASKSGVTRVTIARLEGGQSKTASVASAEPLARALGVSVSDLYADTPLPSTEVVASPIEPALREYLESRFALLDRPTEQELAWFRRQPAIYWNALPPVPEVISELLQLHRKFRR